MTLQAKLGAALALFLSGLVIGLYVGHVWHKAQLADELKAQVRAADKAASQRVEDEQAKVAKTEADLAEQQGLTAKLNSDLSKARADNLVLQGIIDATSFHPAPRAVPASMPGQPPVRCPGHPVSSPEFVQLYNDAARGAAGTGGTAASPR